MWLRIIFLSALVSSTAYSAHAAPNVTTDCTTITGSFTAKQNGKAFKCTSKKTCKTTTCKLGVGYACSVATTTTLSDCTEVTPTPSASGVFTPMRPKGDMLLAPTKYKHKRFPSRIAPKGAGGSLAPATTTLVPDKQLPSPMEEQVKPEAKRPKVTVKRR